MVKLSIENMLFFSIKLFNDVYKLLVFYKEVKGWKIYCKNVIFVDVLIGVVCWEDGLIVVILEIY